MFITKVVSYRGAWESLQKSNQKELNDLMNGLRIFVDSYDQKTKLDKNFPLKNLWEDSLTQFGWNLNHKYFLTESGHRANLDSIGPVKNGVSAALSMHLDQITRWLFNKTAIGQKYGIIKIPVMLFGIEEFTRKSKKRLVSRGTFEHQLTQLKLLEPLNHGYPFALLGYSDQPELLEPQVIALEAEDSSPQDESVIDRSIEFPPEYYQAGIGILSYFGNYLRENYPDEKANVKIEQAENIVRLIIDSPDKENEVIEKALEEYQLIITGQRPPEAFTNNEKLILELNNELRIAKMRVESQMDIIQIQNKKIDKLIDILGEGLTQKPQVTVDFHPQINTSSSVIFNERITESIDTLNDLKSTLPSSSTAHLALTDLEKSLESIENENDPQRVKGSNAMNKFRRLIQRVTDSNDELAKAIKLAENGWDIFRDLAGKYNKIAEWCALPQFPSLFTK